MTCQVLLFNVYCSAGTTNRHDGIFCRSYVNSAKPFEQLAFDQLKDLNGRSWPRLAICGGGAILLGA